MDGSPVDDRRGDDVCPASQSEPPFIVIVIPHFFPRHRWACFSHWVWILSVGKVVMGGLWFARPVSQSGISRLHREAALRRSFWKVPSSRLCGISHQRELFGNVVCCGGGLFS